MKNIIVEPTSRCNLSCSMCLRYSWKNDEGDMDMEVFRNLLASCSAPVSLNLSEFREKVDEFPFSPCGDCGLSDGCGYITPDRDFLCDCNMCEQPCGDCLWSRGILQCP